MKCPFVIKVCTKCGKILVAYEGNFYRHKTGKYGFEGICKICSKEKNKKNRIKNKEKRRVYDKRYYQEHKEEKNKKWCEWYQKHKEERKNYREKYYQDNKEEIRKKARIKHQENREEILSRRRTLYNLNKNHIHEKKRIWRIKNPDKAFNQDIKRRFHRQQKELNGNGITNEQWLEMMNFFDWRCAYSGIKFSSHNKDNDRTTDHIIPLNKNGEHNIWNCVPMMRNYNSSKKDKDMLDWYIQQDFFSEERLQKIYEWIEYAFNKWGDNNE